MGLDWAENAKGLVNLQMKFVSSKYVSIKSQKRMNIRKCQNITLSMIGPRKIALRFTF